MTTSQAPTDPGSRTPSRSVRLLLALAAVAVAFAAADTYVVVLALPDMMASAKVPLDELQRAAPIISGFLLGYVAVLPLIGRIADLRGRVPVLLASLVIFSIGSVLTAVSFDLPSMVSGRFLQGLGGGGLVPATFALVADLYPAHRRTVPLGIVSAVQEIGSVLGPLLGALVLAVADWRAIFALNVAVGAVLAAAVAVLGRSQDLREAGGGPGDPTARRGRFDWLGVFLAVALLAATLVLFTRPPSLMRDLTWGQLFVPWTGSSRWVTPIGAITVGLVLLLVVRCLLARRPLMDLRSWGRAAREADLVGAVLLALALGGVVLTFATADPRIELISPRGRWYLVGTAVASVLFVVHLRRAKAPLVPRGAFGDRAAWGSVLVSFFVGSALIAALIDIPLFARTTVYPDSQVLAALVLVRFLVALPIGAVLGGWWCRTAPAGVVTCVGMLMAAGGFVWMTQWGIDSLSHPLASVPLVLGGLGFGLALAPVNAAMLASTAHDVHGLASAFVVVARMVGMLVGISALTALGMRRYYSETGTLPAVQDVCDSGKVCKAYTTLMKEAGIAQEQVVFAGAAFCAVVAALLALWVFRGAATRGVHSRGLVSGLG